MPNEQEAKGHCDNMGLGHRVPWIAWRIGGGNKERSYGNDCFMGHANICGRCLLVGFCVQKTRVNQARFCRLAMKPKPIRFINVVATHKQFAPVEVVSDKPTLGSKHERGSANYFLEMFISAAASSVARGSGGESPPSTGQSRRKQIARRPSSPACKSLPPPEKV